MDADELMDSLEREFGKDHTKWPRSDSQEYINWRVKCAPPYPETKTMPELVVLLKQAQQTLYDQANAEVRTMYMMDCEADVTNLRVRIERLKLQDNF